MPPRVEQVMPPADALTTVERVYGVLAERFDFACYNAYLAKLLDTPAERAYPVDMAQFERPFAFEGFADGFSPHFYKAHIADEQGGIRPTPTELLGELNGRPVFDKREDTHEYVRSFKARGALFAMLTTLQANPAVRTFTANSTGNHARGVVAAVTMLNDALIGCGAVRVTEHGEVWPADAHKLFRARIYTNHGLERGKRSALVAGGAEVFDTYDTLESAGEAAQKAATRDKETTAYVDPFDTDVVIAGQATLGLELLLDLARQGVDLRETPLTVRVAVGGGGMYAGVVTVMQQAVANGLLHPGSRAVAVEASNNDSTRRELLGQHPLTAQTLNTVAGGIATLRSGRRGVGTVKAFSPGGVRVVDEPYMMRAAEHLARAHRGVPPEFAGTLSLASLLKDIDDGRAQYDGVDVTISCGGNASPELLRDVTAKGLVSEHAHVRQAAAYLGPAVFAIVSNDALERVPTPAVVAEHDPPRRVRAPLNVIARPFV